MIQTDETPQNSYADPFACLFHNIYISGQLTLIKTPAGTCGEWLCVDDHDETPVWHRRLDARAFVWLHDQVKAAIRSGKISEAFSEALTSLEWIRNIGIQYGCFSSEDVADHVHAPIWWDWNSGRPDWALDY